MIGKRYACIDCGKDYARPQGLYQHRLTCKNAKIVINEIKNSYNYRDNSSSNTEQLQNEMFCEELSVENNKLIEENRQLKTDLQEAQHEIMKLEMKHEKEIMKLNNETEMMKFKMEMSQQQQQQLMIHQQQQQIPMAQHIVQQPFQEPKKKVAKNKPANVIEFLNKQWTCENFKPFINAIDIKKCHCQDVFSFYDSPRGQANDQDVHDDFATQFFSNFFIRHLKECAPEDVPIVCVSKKNKHAYFKRGNAWSDKDSNQNMKYIIQHIKDKVIELTGNNNGTFSIDSMPLARVGGGKVDIERFKSKILKYLYFKKLDLNRDESDSDSSSDSE